MRRERLGPVDRAAVAFAAVAIAAIVGWIAARQNGWADAWLPNVATSALSIGVTIAIVDRIVRREAAQKLQPRVERVLYWMGLAFRIFMSAVVIDYAQSHGATFREIPASAREMLDQWLADQLAEDVRREPLEGEWLPMLVLEARDFAQSLQDARSRDLDVLDADLVRVMDDFGWRVAQAVQLLGFSREGYLEDRADTERVALEQIIIGTKDFATVFSQYAPSWMKLMDVTRAAAREHSDRLQRQARNPRSQGDPSVPQPRDA